MSAIPPNSQPTAGQDLQFDRAVPTSGTSDASAQSVVCAACGNALRTWYYDVDGAQLCTACKQKVEQTSTPIREWGPTLRAALFGVGAAVAGAIIYYGVIAITNFEIGIVAILIGFMVGFSVRKGARGRGGRRLQLAAAGLTYFSVAMAYFPLALKGAAQGGDASGQASVITADTSQSGVAVPNANAEADRAAPAEPRSTPETASANRVSQLNPILGLGMLLAFSLALPVIVVVSSLPSGLISALIIGVGMRQAWTMTRAGNLTIAGPFKVGQPKAGDLKTDEPVSTAA